MGIRISDFLELIDERHKARWQEYKVSRIMRLIRVGNAGRNKDGFTGANVDTPIHESKAEHAVEHVPCFVVSVVNVELRRSAPPPLANRERRPRRAEARCGF
jgi:hypothetical protein